MKTNDPEFQRILANIKQGGYLTEINQIVNEVILFYPRCMMKIGINLEEYADEFEAGHFIINGILHPVNKINLTQEIDKDFELDLLTDLDLKTVKKHRNMWNEMFLEYILRYDLWVLRGSAGEEMIGYRAITNMEISDIFDGLEEVARTNEEEMKDNKEKRAHKIALEETLS